MRKIFIIFGLASLLLSACGDSNNNGNGQVNNSSFPKVSKPYRPEQAVQNGDVVNVHGKYSNMDKWHQFIKNIEAEKEDKVRITQYTIEGDPIFYELVYDGKTIHYTYDNSMDAFGSDAGRPSASCKVIGTDKNEQGHEYYVLNECNNDIGKSFWFAKEE
ncbi:DUF4362 domain-containing protein [Paenibacillus sp. J2TS4]|uniref:DUF4362 domain-containing protein n=1 Tax=Paenibacillus sp. J2TS4 TaxID=2807194 RepID=UPI001B040C0C|nr:DUF4362 domain-containing protein [Paenibacillus sp. J2TS4]GIP33541.1 hypothetical protein J2TS4_27510 [Paenibacillus sp. J2TS4]